MKRTFFTVVMLGFWGLALLLAFGTAAYEFASGSKKALYDDLLNAGEAQVRAAHVIWYNETALIGAMLISTALAYLVYVKWLQTAPEQERIISGLKSED